MEKRLGVDEDGQRAGGGFAEEIGADLAAMEMAGECRPVEDLLRSRHLDRRRAVELQRSSRGVNDEIATENTVGGRIDGSEEPEGQRSVVGFHRSPHAFARREAVVPQFVGRGSAGNRLPARPLHRVTGRAT